MRTLFISVFILFFANVLSAQKKGSILYEPRRQIIKRCYGNSVITEEKKPPGVIIVCPSGLKWKNKNNYFVPNIIWAGNSGGNLRLPPELCFIERT